MNTKNLMAMAAGLPVVTSASAAEALRDGGHAGSAAGSRTPAQIRGAANAQEFAQLLADTYNDEKAWSEAQAAGLAAARLFSIDGFRSDVRERLVPNSVVLGRGLGGGNSSLLKPASWCSAFSDDAVARIGRYGTRRGGRRREGDDRSGHTAPRGRHRRNGGGGGGQQQPRRTKKDDDTTTKT